MMSMDKYSDEESQKKLQTYLDAANKEATYADDNLSKPTSSLSQILTDT